MSANAPIPKHFHPTEHKIASRPFNPLSILPMQRLTMSNVSQISIVDFTQRKDLKKDSPCSYAAFQKRTVSQRYKFKDISDPKSPNYLNAIESSLTSRHAPPGLLISSLSVLNNASVSTLTEPNASSYAIPRNKRASDKNCLLPQIKPRLKESALPTTKFVRHT